MEIEPVEEQRMGHPRPQTVNHLFEFGPQFALVFLVVDEVDEENAGGTRAVGVVADNVGHVLLGDFHVFRAIRTVV